MSFCSSAQLNYLTFNKATLNIQKLPGVSFTSQNFRIPSVSLPSATQSSPYFDRPVGGDKLVWEPLRISFLVDEHLTNWLAAFEWIESLAPSDDKKNYIGHEQSFSDAYMIVYNSSNIPFLKIIFEDCIITDLGSIEQSEQTTETQFVSTSITLEYRRYRIEMTT